MISVYVISHEITFYVTSHKISFYTILFIISNQYRNVLRLEMKLGKSSLDEDYLYPGLRRRLNGLGQDGECGEQHLVGWVAGYV